MTPASPPNTPPPKPRRPIAPAPYLVWPVSCREFYGAIGLAMLPTLTWGMALFGVRVLTMVLASIIVATCMHVLVTRIARRRARRQPPMGDKSRRAGGRELIFAHTIVCVLVLLGLVHPLWPVWPVVAMALLIPLILALLGGPGREPVHVAVVLLLALQFGVLPLLARSGSYAGGPDGILARDRLFMGDIRDQRRVATHASPHAWPASRELGGSDAFAIELPSTVAAEVLNGISRLMVSADDSLAGELTEREEKDIHGLIDPAFALRLPDLHLLLLGAAPGRVGTVSLIGIVLAGLYLSYRYILRPRSVVMFVLAFVAGTALFAIGPSAIARAGMTGLWEVLKIFPQDIATLTSYLLFNSDAGFAAVFILALPGTEPLTSRGRRIFLVLAGVGGAALHRINPELPAATLTLCALMPLTRSFDWAFGQRSWLNAR